MSLNPIIQLTVHLDRWCRPLGQGATSYKDLEGGLMRLVCFLVVLATSSGLQWMAFSRNGISSICSSSSCSSSSSSSRWRGLIRGRTFIPSFVPSVVCKASSALFGRSVETRWDLQFVTFTPLRNSPTSLSQYVALRSQDAINRKDFPILDVEAYPGKPLVYLDSAASSHKPYEVLKVMDDYYKLSHSNVHRGRTAECLISHSLPNGYEYHFSHAFYMISWN